MLTDSARTCGVSLNPTGVPGTTNGPEGPQVKAAGGGSLSGFLRRGSLPVALCLSGEFAGQTERKHLVTDAVRALPTLEDVNGLAGHLNLHAVGNPDKANLTPPSGKVKP